MIAARLESGLRFVSLAYIMRRMSMCALANFRKNVRAAMRFRGVSQRALAKKAGLTHPYVNRILTNKVEPSLTVCDRIADALDIECSRLIEPEKKFSLVLLTCGSR